MKKFTKFQLFVLEKGEIKCRDLEKLYGQRFDGELPPSLSGRLDAHVEDCKECQQFAATYKLTVDLARELGKREISKDIQNRLRTKLNDRLGISLPNV